MSNTAPLLACPSCSREMRCDDDGTLPLHSDFSLGIASRQHLEECSTHQHMCPGSYGQGQASRSGPMIRPPYVPAQIDHRAAREALESRECWGCGQRKRRGNGLCKRCFKSLPFAAIGIHLYRAVGDGFEQAFAAALTSLAEQRAETESAKGNLFFDPPTANVSGPPDNRV